MRDPSILYLSPIAIFMAEVYPADIYFFLILIFFLKTLKCSIYGEKHCFFNVKYFFHNTNYKNN